MTSYNFDIGEKERVGSRFIARVHREIIRAFANEKKASKLTQQQIADTIGVNRSVVNRQLRGLENITARCAAELLWAMGWEPEFRAVKRTRNGANIASSQKIAAETAGKNSNSESVVAKVKLEPAA